MLRYHLDDLGAYQFEKLVQSLMKATVGLTLESWGNRGDWGRDGYCPSALRFPDPKAESSGPFIFQVKFVEGANASGARPGTALVSSVRKEVQRIKERMASQIWTRPTHFVFVTNSLVSAPLREKIRAFFSKLLRGSDVTVFGGDDVCDLLDGTSIARAFPQLLSIRDLDTLLERALSKESRERSEAAVQFATELTPVFVPTSSYEKAWRTLQKYHFVVLEGPPEVGKSAIAWMIGLTQAAEGFESIVCAEPSFFFKPSTATSLRSS